MADIKFHCPECKQRIGVDHTAAGVTLECPTCRSSLLIPASASAPVQVLVKRRLATAGGGASSDELERKRKELTDARQETDRLRTENRAIKAELDRVRAESAAAMVERLELIATAESHKGEVGDLRHHTAQIRIELEQTRKQVTLLEGARNRIAQSLAAAHRDLEKAHAVNAGIVGVREDAAAIKRQCDVVLAVLERRQSAAPSDEGVDHGAASHWQQVAETERQRASILVKERDELGAEIEYLKSSRSNAEDALRELDGLRAQLANANRERYEAQSRVATAEAATQQARAELERVSAELKQQEVEAFQTGERLLSLEREQTQWKQRWEDRSASQEHAAAQELARTVADLARMRASLAVVTLERDAARAEIAEREAALSKAAESVNQKELALRMTRTKMEALIRTVSEGDARVTGTRSAEPASRVSFEDRRRQIENELAKASERLRWAKAKRFKLRERLAAKEAEDGGTSSGPKSESAGPSAPELQTALEQLHPEVEAARRDFEFLQAQLNAIEAEVAPRGGGEPTEGSRSESSGVADGAEASPKAV